ncbi:hypothetical protein K438DRAFT_2044443 [Mycena galopus ATCC 62051]|nr:hypothetical protein K438DRAFT_2044443 [Mycena galopus ATCC 62051]
MVGVSFVPVVIVSAGIGFMLYRMAFVEPPMGPLIEEYLKSCTYSETNPFHGFICVTEPFFLDLVGNDVGKSLLTVFGTSGAVMSTYLFIKGGEPGGSFVFSPLITIAHTLAGQAFGAGIVGPILLPALFALSKTFSPNTARSPSPPSYSYTVTLLSMQFIVFLLSMALSSVPPTIPSWVYVNYAFQGFPLLFLPLAFIPRTPAQKQLETPTPTLTISAFVVLKYIYGPLWWISVAQGLNAYFRQGQTFSLPCYFMVLDFAGYIVAFLGIYAVDAVAGEARAAMSVPRLLIGLVAAGPASTMAAYFEAKQRLVVQGAKTAQTEKHA